MCRGKTRLMAPGARNKFCAPCSNLRSFGIKYTVGLLKEVLMASDGFRVGVGRGKTEKGPSDDVIILSQP